MINSCRTSCHHIWSCRLIFLINRSTAKINLSTVNRSQRSIFSSLNLIIKTIIYIYNWTSPRSKSRHTAYFNTSIFYINSSTRRSCCCFCSQTCNILKLIFSSIFINRFNISMNINSSFISCKSNYWSVVYRFCSYMLCLRSSIYNPFIITHIGYSFFWS